jgi:hypothetical protein
MSGGACAVTVAAARTTAAEIAHLTRARYAPGGVESTNLRRDVNARCQARLAVLA